MSKKPRQQYSKNTEEKETENRATAEEEAVGRSGTSDVQG